MLRMLSALLLGAIGLGALPSYGAKDAMTRDKLLAGCEIPARRPMPLSETIAPCDDFYQYVCSEAEKAFTMPEDRSYWVFSFVDNSERLMCAKKKYFSLLEEGYEPKSKRLQPAKTLFQSCMNEKASAAEELKLVPTEMKTLRAIKTRDALLTFFEQRIDDAVSGVVGYGQTADQDDSSRFDMLIMPTMKTLPERSYIDNKDLMKDLEALVAMFFRETGWDKPEARAKWVMSYERSMQKNYPLPAEIRDRFASDTYKPRSYFLKFKNLKLDRFLKRIPEGVKIRDLAPEALTFVNQWLEAADLEQIKSVYAYYTYDSWLDDAYPEFFKRSFDFDHKYLGGPEKRRPRVERCTRMVMSDYGMELDEELIDILFPDFPQDKVVALTDKIRSSIVDGLKANTWLSKDARKEAIKKIAEANLFLVKPTTEKDWHFVPPVTLSATQPLNNRLVVQKALIEREIAEFKQGRSKTQWSMSPLTLNAYYSPPDNKFVMLQGILQYPFFHADDYTMVENIGAIGAVVGHELGHSIDDKGSRYDATGKLRQWMTEADLKAFNERGEKFIKRFEAVGHNGKLTLGENIGDHVGLTFAYHAAFGDEKKPAQAEQKKFFEAYARLWCGEVRPKLKETILKTDPHSLGFARVNEQVIHADGFYEAYQCKKGDAMYVPPKDRIQVW